MFYPDLGTECQLASAPRVRAVGWLAKGCSFTEGPLDASVAAALDRLAAEGWVHAMFMGFHVCEFCPAFWNEHGMLIRRAISPNPVPGAVNGRNVLVPGDGVMYVAPAMVTHYMRNHGYEPPGEFCEAVRRCPEPGTDAYFAALRAFVDVLSAPEHAFTEADFDQSVDHHRAWRARRASEG